MVESGTMTGRLRSVVDGFALSAREAPGSLARLVALNGVAGLAPAAVLYVQKLVIDAIAAGGSDGGGLGDLFGAPYLSEDGDEGRPAD